MLIGEAVERAAAISAFETKSFKDIDKKYYK